MRTSLLLLLVLPGLYAAEPDSPLTGDSKPKPDVPKGELLKDSHTAKEGSVFPGTWREYTLYLPPGFDPSTSSGPDGKPTPFMVFQGGVGVIYQAPVVFDNLVAKNEIPPLVGIFVGPGIVPAAIRKALPRYNHRYESDSVTDTYARFLIGELLPAIEQKHGIKLSTDPNDAAITGYGSGGTAAFMVAWHRPDRFRRVFTGSGNYVGIRGADALPVLVRKVEPKPLRIFLQSGPNEGNQFGDWWMANQMMELSLTWAGYDVNHAWGDGANNADHASHILPDVLRWLWKGWPEAKEVKANPRGESKWPGYQVCVEGSGWSEVATNLSGAGYITSNKGGEVCFAETNAGKVKKLDPDGGPHEIAQGLVHPRCLAFNPDGALLIVTEGISGNAPNVTKVEANKPNVVLVEHDQNLWGLAVSYRGAFYVNDLQSTGHFTKTGESRGRYFQRDPDLLRLVLSPDQHLLYVGDQNGVSVFRVRADGSLDSRQGLFRLENDDGFRSSADGLCVDTNGWLYVATSLGIQVCNPSGSVIFIIPTPQQPHDVCFGGKDLGELFIACGDKIYKRQTKVQGIVSGQMIMVRGEMMPIKPAATKL